MIYRIRVEEEKQAAIAALKEMKELELSERIANGEDEEDASKYNYTISYSLYNR